MKKLTIFLLMSMLAVTVISQTYEFKYNARESIFDMVRSDGIGGGGAADSTYRVMTVYDSIYLGLMGGRSGVLDFTSATGATGAQYITNDDYMTFAGFIRLVQNGDLDVTGDYLQNGVNVSDDWNTAHDNMITSLAVTGTTTKTITATQQDAGTVFASFTDIGFAYPLTTPGDIMVADGDGQPDRLGIGTEGQVLTVGATSVEWSAIDSALLVLSNDTAATKSGINIFQVLGLYAAYNIHGDSITGNWFGFDKFGTGPYDFNMPGTMWVDTLSIDTTLHNSMNFLGYAMVDTTTGQIVIMHPDSVGGSAGGEWDATANGQTTPTTATSIYVDSAMFSSDGTEYVTTGAGAIWVYSNSKIYLVAGVSDIEFSPTRNVMDVGGGADEIYVSTTGASIMTGAAPTAALDVGGGQNWNVTTVNAATYDLLVTDHIVHVTYTTTGAVTSLTLPTAQTLEGRMVIIKDAGGNATTNNITIDTEGAQTIDGSATLVLNGDYDCAELYSDGTNWFIKNVY